jgi:hypothetical protein
MTEILEFLDRAEAAGHNVKTSIGPQVDFGVADVNADGTLMTEPATVRYEARQIKALFLQLSE